MPGERIPQSDNSHCWRDQQLDGIEQGNKVVTGFRIACQVEPEADSMVEKGDE